MTSLSSLEPPCNMFKAVSSVAESCYAQHLSWVAQSKIPEGDRAIHEDEVLAEGAGCSSDLRWTD